MSEPNPFINKAPSTAAVQKKTNTAYENNPFFVATKGIELLFSKAKSIGIALAVLMAFSFLSSLPTYMVPAPVGQPPQSTQETTTETTTLDQPSTPATVSSKSEQSDKEWNEFVNGIKNVPASVWAIVGLIVMAVIVVATLVGFLIQGAIDYTSAQIAKGKEVTLSEAFSGIFKNYWGYVWVQIVAGFKTFLWSLLFIIPGIIMSYRYSLAGVSYFDKKLKGNGSVKHSLALTKGAWLTTFASNSLVPLLTLGAANGLFTPGTRAILYRQFEPLTAKDQPKPKAHILSWLTLMLPLAFWLLITLVVMLIVAVFNT